MRNTRLAALAKSVESTTQFSAALRQSGDIVKMSNEYLRRLNRFFEDSIEAPGDHRFSFKKIVKKYGRPSTWSHVPSDYLAYLYGIAPLGDDIANGLDLLTSYRVTGLGMTMMCRNKQVRRENFSEYAQLVVGAGVFPGTIDVQRVQTTKASYRFDLPSWYLDTAPVRAPFSTQYELAPYSFVLDWFLPVGTWIQALESAQFSPFFREGSETVFIQDRSDLSTARSPQGVIRTSGTLQRGVMQRRALTEYPHSVLVRPSFKPFPGASQVSQGLSLLTQRMQRWR
jgi:hypothetical protein